MSKLQMKSASLTRQNILRLEELFPGCVVEAKDDKGEICLAVNFERLRQELSDSLVEGERERYHLDWPGKHESLVLANAPTTKTLRPLRDESVDFDTTKNLFLEGDNLDALKLIQENYLGKIKMIYIDPPYNTGRNLIYKNDFRKTKEAFLEESKQIHEDGNKLAFNPETNGRFHSDWLSMMFQRLKIAKNILAKDGVLVCAIDENEFGTLSILMKEIFSGAAWEHAYVSVVHNPRGQQGLNFSYINEYLIFIYPSDTRKYIADFRKDETDARNLRDSGTESDRADAKNCFYPFIIKDDKIIEIGEVPSDGYHPTSANIQRPDGSLEVWPMTDSGSEKKWRYARQSVEQILDKLEPKKGRNLVQIIFHKDMGTMRSVWSNARHDSSEYGTKLVENLIPGSGFTYPKSLWAVYDAVYAATSEDKNAIVMDFFAGSSTTAHAVMQLNADDGGNRRFIMAQIDEKIAEDSTAFQAGFKTIAEIGRERIRRAGKKIMEGDCHLNWNRDVGFRLLKIDSSNMKDVFYRPDEFAQQTLDGMVDNVKADRSEEDLLFQVLVDWGVDLSLPIARETLGSKTVFIVGEDAAAPDLIACFDANIGEDLMKLLAERHPLRVVFRDTGFATDSVKINAQQIFKQFSSTTEFKTV